MFLSMSCRHQFKCNHVVASVWHPLLPVTITVLGPVVVAQVRPDSEQTVSIQAALRRLSGALLIAEVEPELKKSRMQSPQGMRYRRSRNSNLPLQSPTV